MEQCLTSYLNCLTDGDENTLDTLITLQYRKFTQFFNVLREYSGMINKMKYDFISPESLDVKVTMDTKRDLINIQKELLGCMSENGYNGDVRVEKKTLYIIIMMSEEGKP